MVSLRCAGAIKHSTQNFVLTLTKKIMRNASIQRLFIYLFKLTDFGWILYACIVCVCVSVVDTTGNASIKEAFMPNDRRLTK